MSEENNKTENSKFDSKNITHDPNAQSLRAVFGLTKSPETTSAKKK